MSGIDIRFRASGQQEISSAMDAIKQKSSQATASMIADAKSQADSAKDQLKLIDDQVKALERKNRITAASSRVSSSEKKDQLKDLNQKEYQQQVADIKAKLSTGQYTKGRARKETGKADEALSEGNVKADSEFKDELKLIREQEKQGEIHNKLLRDNIEAIKATSNVEVNQMRKGSDAVLEELDENASPMRQMARDVAQEKYLEEQSRGKKGEESERKNAGKVGLFGELLGVDNITRFLGTAGRFAGTQNGFDMIGETGRGTGQLVGSILGGIIGTLIEPGGGTVVGAGIGGSIGGTIGGGAGDFEQRRALAVQQFLTGKNQYEATTQKSLDKVPDTSDMGISAIDMLATMKQVAVTSASSSKATENAVSMIAIGKGAGVGEDVMKEYLTLFRGTNKDIGNLVAGVMSKGKSSVFGGGDYTFLNEFLHKMSQLQTSMRSHQAEVSSGAAFSILEAFNSVGGAFSSKDPRSMALIQRVDQSLSSPGSDALKSASFLALRKMHPNMDLASIIEEQQKGLNSPQYMSAMLQEVKRRGGDRSTQIQNIAGVFGLQDNYSAARLIYENQGKLSHLTGNKLKKGMEELGITGDFRATAAGRTTPLEKEEANIKNQLLVGNKEAIDAMAGALKTAIQSTLSGATIYMENGYIMLKGSPTPPKKNTTIIPNAYRSQSGGDLRTQQGRQQALSNGDFGPKI